MNAPNKQNGPHKRNRVWLGRKSKVRIDGVRVMVPSGFGSAYRSLAASELTDGETLRDLLELVGWTAEPSAIESWPKLRRIEAQLYAVRVHLRAGDNPVTVPPRPEWFPEPWKGASADPILAPKPTVLPLEVPEWNAQ
jgi:hypothetical protein